MKTKIRRHNPVLPVLVALVVTFSFNYTSGQIVADWPDEDYMHFSINPAMSLEESSITISATHARRWSDIQSSPTLSSLAVLVPFLDDKMTLGAHLYSDRVGPFSSTGIGLNYAYKVPMGWGNSDYLALGFTGRLTQLRLDPDHFISSDVDPVLENLDPKSSVIPPSFSVGFSYQSGIADYATPVQFIVGAAISQFLPSEHRFSTFSLERTTQWYGHFGLKIAATDEISIEPTLLMSNSTQTVSNYFFRIKSTYHGFGWIALQYSKAGYLSSQLGVDLRTLMNTNSGVSLSATHGWYLGNLTGQLGNSLSLGISYRF